MAITQKKSRKTKITKTKQKNTPKSKTKPKSIVNKKINYDYEKINECLNGLDVIYYINLDRSTDRREKVENNLKNIKIPSIRFSAVDGKLFSDEAVYGKFENAGKGEDNSTTTKTEYACLLSHLELIREFANSKYETALILEDDFTLEFSKYWNKSMKEIISEGPCNWDIIMLGYTLTKNLILPNLYTLNYQDNIYKIYSTLSYVINKEAARKLISKIYKNGVYHLDPEIKHVADSYLYKKLVTYVYKYPYFTYPIYNKSTIKDEFVPLHTYAKIMSIYNLISDFRDNQFIYKYILNEKERFGISKRLEIYDTFEYFLAFTQKYYGVKAETDLFFRDKKTDTNYFHIIRKPTSGFTVQMYSKIELVNLIENNHELKMIKNYLKNNIL